MADEDIVLRYRADVTQLRTDINNIIALNEKLAQSVKDASIASKQSAKDQKQAASVSKKSIETQINQQNRLKKSIQDTGKAAGKSATQFKKATKAVQGTGKQVKKLNKQSGVFSNTVKRIGAGIAIAFSVQKIGQFLQATVDISKEFDSIRRSLDFIEDGAIGGSATFEFLTDLAEEYGLELRSTVEAYRQFSGAARLAGLSSQETQSIFRDTSKAITALGLGAQQADRIFLALSQIVSKGVVSAEELRRQLGDALPGAFSIAAKSAGKTEAEFNKLLSTGQILSKDFLPNFAKLLGSTFEEGAIEGAKSLNAELNRLQNRLTEIQLKVGEDFAPIWIKLKTTALEALDSITTRIKALGTGITAIINGIVTLGRDFNIEELKDALLILKDPDIITSPLFNLGKSRFNKKQLQDAVDDILESIDDANKKIQARQEKALNEEAKLIEDSYKKGIKSKEEYEDELDKIEKKRADIRKGNLERDLQALEAVLLSRQKSLDENINKVLPQETLDKLRTGTATVGGTTFPADRIAESEIKTYKELIETIEFYQEKKEELLLQIPPGITKEQFFQEDSDSLNKFNAEIARYESNIQRLNALFEENAKIGSGTNFLNINRIEKFQAQIQLLNDKISETKKSLEGDIKPIDVEKATIKLLDYEDLLKKSLLEVARIRDEQSKIFRESADEDVKKAAKANLDTAERAFKTLEKLYDDARERRQEAIDDFRKGTDDLSVIFTSQLREALEEGVDSVDIYERLASKLVEDLEQAKRLIDAQVPAIVNARIQNELPIEGETGPLPFDSQRALEIEDEVKADAEKLKIIEDENFYQRIEALRQYLEERGFLIIEAGDAEVEGWFERNALLLQATADLYSQITDLTAAFTDRRLQELDRELRAVRENSNEEEETLRQQRENRLITEEYFQNELARIKEKEKETEEKINKEKNKLARKQAILEKSAALFQIALSTRQAYTVALANPPGPPTTIPVAALALALGLAQAAAVIATPIPQFARGTKGKKDSGMAIVGEEGPEMTFLDRGTKVLPAKQTKQYSNVFDAMYDNRFDDYVLKEYVSPALEAQKKQYESQRQETFAQNIVNSMTGLTYYDLEASRKKGQYINNIDEFAKAVAKASEINYRRL